MLQKTEESAPHCPSAPHIPAHIPADLKGSKGSGPSLPALALEIRSEMCFVPRAAAHGRMVGVGREEATRPCLLP